MNFSLSSQQSKHNIEEMESNMENAIEKAGTKEIQISADLAEAIENLGEMQFETFSAKNIVKEFKPDALKRSIAFDPENPVDMQFMSVMLRIISELWDMKIDTNLEMTSDGFDINAGYEVVISPLQQKGIAGASGLQLQKVLLIQVPTMQTVIDRHENGPRFVVDRVRGAFVQQALVAVRADKQMPVDVSDFISLGRRADPELAAFKAMAPGIMKFLRREVKLAINSARELENLFASHSYSESLYPKLERSFWKKLLKFLAAGAVKQNLSPAIYERWMETRDKAVLQRETDADIESLLDNFIDNDDGEENETVAA